MDVNDDESLVLISSKEVLEVNKRGESFYKTMRGIVKKICRCTFHLQYTNQSTDSMNPIIHKLQEAFPEQRSMRYVKLAIENTYNNKKIII